MNERNEYMKYTEFVNGYKNSKAKEAWVDRVIKTIYLPYSTKKAEAQQIARLSSHVMNEDGSEGAYKRDTASQYFLTQIRIIANYTSIEIGDKDVVKAYDALSECGALDMVLALLPESELKMFKTMVDMAMDDMYINEADVGAVLSTKLEALSITAETIISALEVMSSTQNTNNNK